MLANQVPTALAAAIQAAQCADDAFGAAIKAAGYKSRWDWRKENDSRPMDAYNAKVAADAAMGRAFEDERKAVRS